MTRISLSFWTGVMLSLLVSRHPSAVGQYTGSAAVQSGGSQQSSSVTPRGNDWQAGYPYRRQSTTRLPASRRYFGGFIGNPYRDDGVAPTGLPLGRTLQDYYGTAASFGGGNPFANRPASKPFSNLHLNRYRPLITSREAAQIEASRGLWLW